MKCCLEGLCPLLELFYIIHFLSISWCCWARLIVTDIKGVLENTKKYLWKWIIKTKIEEIRCWRQYVIKLFESVKHTECVTHDPRTADRIIKRISTSWAKVFCIQTYDLRKSTTENTKYTHLPSPQFLHIPTLYLNPIFYDFPTSVINPHLQLSKVYKAS